MINFFLFEILFKVSFHGEHLLVTLCFFVVDVIRSMIGTVIWIAIITTWVVIFQSNRVAWGITADKISFLIPKGIP